jgi:hypothetical protein
MYSPMEFVSEQEIAWHRNDAALLIIANLLGLLQPANPLIFFLPSHLLKRKRDLVPAG